MDSLLAEHLADRIPKAARQAHRRFPLIDAEDFEQEMWSRIAANPERLAALLNEDGGEELIWNELRRAADRYGWRDDRDRRARKAAAAGYRPRDEVFYDKRMTGHILSELIQSEWEIGAAMERATKGLDLSGIRIQDGDITDGFIEYETMLVDIMRAYEALKAGQKNTLLAWYSEGSSSDADDETRDEKWGREAIASSMGITYDALKHRVYRALDALIWKLGGRNPYKRSGDEPKG